MDVVPAGRPPMRSLIGWALAIGLAQFVSLIQAPAGADSWSGSSWFSPAVGASALLLARRQHWPALLCAYWLTCTLVLLGFGKSLGAASIGPVNNVVEVILIAWLLWPDREWVEGRARTGWAAGCASACGAWSSPRWSARCSASCWWYR